MTKKSTDVIYKELKASYCGSQKNTFDADNYFYRWYRPISFFPSAILIRWGVSANSVTACGAICSLTAFALLSMGKFQAGASLYLLAYLIDFIDGNIARYAGKATYFGKMIDGLVDTLSFLLFVAIGFGNAGYGNAWFGARVEVFLGLATAFIFLFRSYFYLRVSYIMHQSRVHGSVDSQHNQVVDGGVAAIYGRLWMISYGKKIYFGLISGMPIFLLLAAAIDVFSLYLSTYFFVFVLATSFEVVYGLRRIWLKDQSLGG